MDWQLANVIPSLFKYNLKGIGGPLFTKFELFLHVCRHVKTNFLF